MKNFFKILFILVFAVNHFNAVGQSDFIDKVKDNTLFILNYANDTLLSSGYLMNDLYVITCAHGVADYVRRDTTVVYNNKLKIKTYVEKYSKPSDAEMIMVGRDSLSSWAVSDVFIHPNYAKNRNYDPAILKLHKPIKSNKLEIFPFKAPQKGDTILILGYSENSVIDNTIHPASNNLQPWYNIVTSTGIEGNLQFEFINQEIQKLNGLPFGKMVYPGDSGGPSFLCKNNRFYLSGVHVGSVRTLFDANGNTPEDFIPYSRNLNLVHVEDWVNSILNK